MNVRNNLLLGKKNISYRNKNYPCNCCNCPTSKCQCSCYCKCHIQTIILQFEKKKFNKNYSTEDNIKNKELKLVHNNSTNNIIYDDNKFYKKLISSQNNENEEKENINILNDDNINKNYVKKKLIPINNKKIKNVPSNYSFLMKQKILNQEKSKVEFNKLLYNFSKNKIDNNKMDLIQYEKENKNFSNYNPDFNEEYYNNFYKYSKKQSQTDRNNYKTNKNLINNNSPNNNDYFLYCMTNENFSNKQKRKIETKKINKKTKIKEKKEKLLKYLDNNNNKEQISDNNLINNYLSESIHFENNKQNDKNIGKNKNKKNSDIIDIIKKYENKKININNIHSSTYLIITSFNFSYKRNSLNNEENQKLIKIYEKKIQQLEKKLEEANEKINNNIIEINKLKDELNQNNKKLKTKSNTNNRNILGRNNDSLIIKLPENFQSFKIDKEESLTDDNILNKTSNDNSDNIFKIYNNNVSTINNVCKIYKKKISSKIYKKSIIKKLKHRTLSQPNLNEIKTIENINKILNKNESKEKNKIIKQKLITNKIIYTIYPLSSKQKLLSFDLTSKNFSFKNINSTMSDNFTLNYIESFREEDLQYNSICLFNKNIIYIITGKNSDIFYRYDTINNIFNKICSLKNNHANGVLTLYKDIFFCLSGKFNKKVELFKEEKKEWEEIGEMNIERSCFSTCVIKDKYLFCLFGYSNPTNKYLDTIEFCDISNLNLNSNNNILNWKYLKYMNNNMLNMNICGFVCMNYKNEKIIIFGGINGVEKSPVDKFYQIILDKNFGNNNYRENIYIEETNKEANNIYKNKCYYFPNGLGKFYDNEVNDKNDNIYYYAGFDNNYNVHVIQMKDKLIHDVYFFNN